MRFYLLLFLLFTSFTVSAQTISGKITDSLGREVSGANISLKKRSIIVAYQISGDDGTYSFSLSKGIADSLEMFVSALGYKPFSLRLQPQRNVYNITLGNSPHQLETVQVKNNIPRIRMNGDTISYKASAFQNKGDRVIGDVLKRIPGIIVAKDGKISFNGKAISNFYIDGDDVLDDRYNIATRSVPPGIVDQIQVFQNHQPVKLLKNKVYSNNVALNLTLKEDAKLKLIGNETIGGGIKDKYFADLSGMLFKKRHKGLNLIKANNTSIDLMEDLKKHDLESFQKRIDNVTPQPLLSSGTKNPDLDNERYLRNSSQMYNTNSLIKLRQDEQFRLNAYYLHDRKLNDYTTSTLLRLPTGNVNYGNSESSTAIRNAVNANLNYLINKDSYYLSESFVYANDKSLSGSDIINSTPFSSRQDYNVRSISNELNLMRYTKADNIFEIYSYVGFNDNTQKALYDPGIFTDLFNSGTPFPWLRQTGTNADKFTNNYATIRFAGKNVTHSYKLGMTYQDVDLVSGIDATGLSTLPDSLANNLSWKKAKVYAEASIDLTLKKLKVNIAVPIFFQSLNAKDPGYGYSNKIDRYFINPSVSLRYDVGKESDLSLTYTMRNDLGIPNDLYRGYIITGFRNLNTNDGQFADTRNTATSLGYSYRKTENMFFLSLFAAYNRNHNSSIRSQVYFGSYQRNILLHLPNNSDSYSLNARASKYVFPLYTTVTISSNLAYNTSRQLQNGQLIPISFYSSRFEANTESNINKKFSLSGNILYSRYQTKPTGNVSVPNIGQLQYRLGLEYEFSDSFSVKAANSYYSFLRSDMEGLRYNFTDASARYNFPKTKLDLVISLNNIFDVKTYRTASLNDLSETNTAYTLPGRMILAKLNFSL
ncbi:carboxypeptidase regulatory-like domain-containing protein [Pedobacter jeongneungensis]|uniref:carboxypeptidase regulatory-like domain-containing protein n=1 Tax=Pedobacter jeongneungensis TaxID=947309 RepID=UPI0004697D20|nr:carboxypeptidase regulatory-like domain-containing protein [Pedobacter jeongneungensis]